MRAAALAVLLGAAACGPEVAVGSEPVALADLDAALQACIDGDPDAGVARLDTVLRRSPASVDALTTRGLCRWARFAADSARADAEGAYADLSAAIAAAEADGSGASATPLDRVYSHRAFVARAVGEGWEATLADLSAAIAAAPGDPTHRLDRGVAHRLAGDTAAARADLEVFLSLADSADVVRRDMVADMLADLGPEAGPGAPPDATPPGP